MGRPKSSGRESDFSICVCFVQKTRRNRGSALDITGMNLRVLYEVELRDSSLSVPLSAYGWLGTRAIRTLSALPAAQCDSPVTTMLMAAEYERDTTRL